MNLLYDKWIPVKRINGECDEISPISLLEDTMDNPVKSVNTVRPDFDGAVLQFLIGLYQVLLSPKDDDEWSELLESPPNMDSLSEKIDLIAPAFVLDEGEFRFMQDKSVIDSDVWDIQNMLIEIHNTHFIKDGTIRHLCPKCAMMALLTLELNSPSGGRGHMTSLRGGGPLTTLMSFTDNKTTLWRSVMLNVLPQDEFDSDENLDITSSVVSKIFPWLGVMPNSEKGEVVVPKDLHPYHVYWNVPRRIYFDFSNLMSGNCDVCGKKSDKLLTHYWSRPNGIKYSKWSHPLTPYYLKKDKLGDMMLPIRGKEGEIAYSNWIGIVLSSEDNLKVPAKVVQKIPYLLYDNYSDLKISDLKIHAFGYSMDNAKATYWQEGLLPTIVLDDNIRDSFFKETSNIVNAASDILYVLISKIKGGLTRRPNDLKSNFDDVRAAFWHDTETAFYSAMDKLTKAITSDLKRNDDNHPETDKVKTEWLREVKRICINLFKEKVTFPIYGEADPSLAAASENELRRDLTVNNSKLCKILGLPVKVKSSKSKVKK